MEIVWKVSRADAHRVQEFVRAYRRDPFVRHRVDRNITNRRRNIHKSSFWHTHMMALLTTQQRSGPNSPVSRFLRAKPFPIRYEECLGRRRVATFIERRLTAYGGIRRSRTIAEWAAANLAQLEAGLWEDVRRTLRSLVQRSGINRERAAAHFLAAHLQGIGPKQSRNMMQHLGLSRYEIPLDSRLAKWLNEFGFPMALSATALSDSGYYDMALDGFQALCKASGVYPTVLDAAIFRSFDKPADSIEP